MADFGVYWPFFSKKDESWPVDRWWVGAGSCLTTLEPGDRLWLFTSGQKCKRRLEGEGFTADAIAENAGYLAQVLTVGQIVPDQEGGFDYRIMANLGLSPRVFPDLLIDDLIRPEGREATIPIGTLRQGPWKLSENTVDLLKAALLRERTDVSETLFGASR